MPSSGVFSSSDPGATYLVLDTETTGVPLDYQAPVTAWDNWPRLVQIAWILYDNAGTALSRQAFIIRPAGFAIPPQVTRVHHITTARALEEGVPLALALDCFCRDLAQVACVVAHNLEFDGKVIGAEFNRMGRGDPFVGKRMICTMRASIAYCALPGKNGKFKWPRLTELYAKLFGQPTEELHDAGADAEMAAQCFWELKRRGVL